MHTVSYCLCRLGFLAALALVSLGANPGRAAQPGPITARLDLLTTPSLGGQAQVIWAGIADFNAAGEIAFTVAPPAGQKAVSGVKSVQLTRGRVADVTFSFNVPVAGTYKVRAAASAKVLGVRYTKTSELKLIVPPAGKSKVAWRVAGDAATEARADFTPADATELKLDGKLIGGKLENNEDTNLFRFTLTTTSTVFLATLKTGSLIDTEMELYGADMEYITGDDDGGIGDSMSLIQEPLTPGTYYVAVYCYDTEGGDYSILGLVSNPAAVRTLPVDESGTWGAVGENPEWFKFTVREAGDYTFEIANSNINPQLALYGPNNQTTLIARDDDGGYYNYPAITRRLEAGTYYVQVDSDNYYTGMFLLRAIKGAKVKPVTLPMNGKAGGRIDYKRDYDWYRFTVDKAGTYQIEVTAGTMRYFDIYLYRDLGNGQRAYVSSNGGYARSGKIAITWDRNFGPGNFLIKVEPQVEDNYATGDYSIALRKLNEFVINPLATGQSQVQAPTTSTRSLWYAITVTTTTQTCFFGTLTNNNGGITLELWSSDLTNSLFLDAGSFSSPLLANMELAPGTYTLHVQTWIDDKSKPVGYSFSMVDFQIRLLSIYDDRVTGNIPAPGEAEWWMINIEQTDNYTVETFPRELTDNIVSIYGPGNMNTLLAQNDNAGGGNMGLIMRRLEAGSYFIKVEGRTAADTGNYLIELKTTYADLFPDRATTGELTFEGDADYFRFTIPDAGVYTLETFANQNQVKDTLVYVYGPNSASTLRAQDDNSGQSGMSKMVRNFAPGTYYVVVLGRTPQDVGDFSIMLSETYGELVPDAARSAGRLRYRGDVQYFKFVVSEPKSYTIETWPGVADAKGALTDNTVSLYGPNNPFSPVLATDDNSGQGNMGRVTWNCVAGTYYVAVRGRTAADFGNFYIQVRKTLTMIGLNQPPVAGEISDSSARGWFGFTVAKQGIYIVETITGTLKDDYLMLFGPGNMTNMIAKDDNSGEGNMAKIRIALAPGTYYAQVSGRYNRDIGRYRIQVYEAIQPLTEENAWAAWGNIDNSWDADWYSFTVPSAGEYTIDSLPGGLTDSYMRLYGPNSMSQIKAWNDDSGVGNMARITATLQPGTYYVKLQGYGAHDLGSYTISVRGYMGEGVLPLSLVGSLVNQIDSVQDADWYSFYVGYSLGIQIQTQDYGLRDSLLYLYGPNNSVTLLTMDDDSGPGNMSQITRILAPGIYYIKVTGYGQATGKYGLSMNTY